jgi:TnpA family transposase
VLLATLIAHGTNLGISAMGYSAEGSQSTCTAKPRSGFFNEETLKAANKMLVDYHYHLPLTGLWGTGRRSSSDGQRFLLRQSSLLGPFYPRYFGYYDQALFPTSSAYSLTRLSPAGSTNRFTCSPACC